MAQTILKEFTYNGSKVIVEVARRDAQGRTIDTTYATITALAEKQDKLTAGNGITISGNTIASLITASDVTIDLQ